MDAQAWTALGLAAAAALYLLRRLWGKAGGEGEGACGKCGSGSRESRSTQDPKPVGKH